MLTRLRIRKKFPHVLLLHAGGLDHRMWEPLINRIKGGYVIHAPDLRGHGSSPSPPGEFAHAEDLVRLLDRLKAQKTIVVGCSYGGWVALQLATLAPERVQAIALMPGTLADTENWSRELTDFRAQEQRLLEAGDIDGAVELGVRTWVRDEQIAYRVADMSRTAFELQQGVEVHERELPVDLRAIGVPTLAVSGGLDFVDFARIADRVAAEVPGAERASIDDAGHLIALERPDAAAELLLPWLERVSA
jgi:pimeloyl-ACP methyl ester carboxylesterase